MIVTFSIFGVLQLLVLYPVHLEAQISFPDGNATYWLPGSPVKLPWQIKFSSSDIFGVEWSFTRSGSTQAKGLAVLSFRASVPVILDQTYNITDGATLVFKNANLSHNGTYTLRVSLTAGAGGNTITSDVLVIILVQPVANITCSGTTNRDFQCVCKGIVGNPPPSACWYSNSGQIGHFGYLENNLYIDNITRGESGTYMCKVKSHNLTDTQNITFEKPEIMSFTADKDVAINEPFTLTCKAKETLPTTYWIMFNGTYLDDSQNGVKETIVTNYGVRTYKCIASNIIGNSSKELSLNITGERTTTTSNTPSGSSPNIAVTTRPPTKSHKTLGPGPIAGIVIGILLAVIVAVAVIYWCYVKNPNDRGICGCTKKEGTGESDQVVNDGLSPYDQPSMTENPYESVDGERINSDQQAGPSGDTSPPPSGLPPVYAVVDKNKKTKKPPSKSQPASVTYASLDPVDLQPDSSKMRDRSREETNYADIDLGKLQSDLV